tara:strand:+ start:135 stop:524 length:390 start_codon:yes stop_codon:yes gene_type:complete
MNERELIKLIIHHGKVDHDIFYESFFVEDSLRIKEVFRILQEIDSTVYMYFFPMELDFLKIHEMKDKNNKKSIFSANSYSEIMLAKKYAMNKLNRFFEKVRFDPIEDQIVKMATRLFIRSFVYEKIKKF